MARFEREAKLLASLNHAGIATIHRLREVGGMRLLEMELVLGRDLSRRLAEGRIPIGEALHIGAAIGSTTSRATR